MGSREAKRVNTKGLPLGQQTEGADEEVATHAPLPERASMLHVKRDQSGNENNSIVTSLLIVNPKGNEYHLASAFAPLLSPSAHPHTNLSTSPILDCNRFDFSFNFLSHPDFFSPLPCSSASSP